MIIYLLYKRDIVVRIEKDVGCGIHVSHVSPEPSKPQLLGKICRLHHTWVCFRGWQCSFELAGDFLCLVSSQSGLVFSNARPLLLRVTLDVKHAYPEKFVNYTYLFISFNLVNSDVCCNTPIQLEIARGQWAVVEQHLPGKNLIYCITIMINWEEFVNAQKSRRGEKKETSANYI